MQFSMKMYIADTWVTLKVKVTGTVLIQIHSKVNNSKNIKKYIANYLKQEHFISDSASANCKGLESPIDSGSEDKRDASELGLEVVDQISAAAGN